MKKFFDIVMPVKTAACYIFTATMCVYAVLDLVFGWGGLPDNYLFSFLLLSLAGGVLQIVAFTELVIKRLRYTLRLFVFAVPYLAVLSAIAAGFGWLPAAQPGAWALFFLIFLAVLLTMTLGFELYYRISFVITPSFTGASMIFAFMVMLANRLNCWKTMPIFCLVTLMSVDLSVRSVPSKRICPDVGVSSRLRERKNVDFPQPDGPMMAITSPLFTSVLMPFNTSCSPKLLCRSFTSSITLLSFIASQSPLKFAYSVA